ncbi:MAG TPA: xylose isomerase [Candidatus Paceibacterota bacterium]|nr:xylose isomerase [Verrucomicrobiota bacterium]HRY51647.1 xylose isomerase [Candidatus Paceibacterota bacterium]HSA01350.1 xylose isomerase [Candidatus Paceibacterota bacterium]
MKTYFPKVQAPIAFEGRNSRNPLAFKWYDAKQKVRGKTMAEHFRFAVAYWHTFKGNGADMFGPGAWVREWNVGSPMEAAENTLRANFEFCQKLGAPFYCFHDRDIAPEGATFAESCNNLETIVALAKKLQKDTGTRLLWGTANLFSNPRYTHGAGTNPDVHVFAYAAAQLKHAIEATHELGGQNYVFWGGREGYETLLNTRYGQEQEQFAALLQLAVDHKKKIGFKGQFLIEPKPHEPTKHQYDFDTATVLSFLRAHGLYDYFKINVEANHATLAGHTFEHELTVAAAENKLGSIDANIGDLLLGWDTDQFPSNLYSTTTAMMVVLQQKGGLNTGGFNFDAKCRRGSNDVMDLFYAHIGGMDAFARGLLVADKILSDKPYNQIIEDRYASWKSPLGKKILSGKASLDALEQYVLKAGEPVLQSGRQELLEIHFNDLLNS